MSQEDKILVLIDLGYFYDMRQKILSAWQKVEAELGEVCRLKWVEEFLGRPCSVFFVNLSPFLSKDSRGLAVSLGPINRKGVNK